MTPHEAVVVIQIASHADGGCPTCVRAQVQELVDAFPEVDWKAAAGEIGDDYTGERIIGMIDDWRASGDKPSLSEGK